VKFFAHRLFLAERGFAWWFEDDDGTVEVHEGDSWEGSELGAEGLGLSGYYVAVLVRWTWDHEGERGKK
jgi:hypothetical protein